MSVLWLVFATCLLQSYTTTVGQYLCYRDESCSLGEPRAVFSLADSHEHCCGMPYILAGRPHQNTTNCLPCGQPHAEAVGSTNVLLMAPEALVLQIEARAYSSITWLYNDSVMHDFLRLRLEDFSKRLVLVNTTVTDAGLYEADVHTIANESVIHVLFNVSVQPTTPPTISEPPSPTDQVVMVTVWPQVIELNIYQSEKTVMFICEGNNSQELSWTSSGFPGSLEDYCNVNGEAPIDSELTTQPPQDTTTPFDMFGEAPLFTSSSPQMLLHSTNLPTPTPTTTLNPTSAIHSEVRQSTLDFVGEAEMLTMLQPTQTPIPTDLRRKKRSPDTLPPTNCAVVTANGTQQSLLMIEGDLLMESINFTCTGENNGTGVSSTVQLVIKDMPFFTRRPPESVNPIVSQSLNLTCEATANPAPCVSWLKRRGNKTVVINGNDSQIITASSVMSTLTLHHLLTTHTGEYICQAESNGSVSQTTTFINVRVPANITKGPVNQTVSLGTIAELTCESFGIPVPMISWQRELENGTVQLLDDMSSSRTYHVITTENLETSTTTSILTFPHFQPSERGLYICNTLNGASLNMSYGYLYYQAAFLDILPIPQPIIQPELIGPVAENEELSLSCIAGGSPTPLITWLINGRPALQSSHAVVTYTDSQEGGGARSNLSVNADNVVPNQGVEGVYICRLDNIIDPITNLSITANVTVNIQPIDDCVGATCANNGMCVDQVRGFKCHCVESFQGPNCSTPVVSLESPVIVQSPEGKDAELLEEVLFFCRASGSPLPTFSWQKDGVEIAITGQLGMLSLTGVTPEDRGLYTCMAHNANGNSSKSAAGLLTIRGVFQYLVNFTDCSTHSLQDAINLMTNLLAGRELIDLDAVIYSFTQRPLKDGPPPTDQVLVTVVTGRGYQASSTTIDIQRSLFLHFENLTLSHGCNFTSLRRYDGCPKESYSFSTNSVVIWPESDISLTPLHQHCPCGSLNTSGGERRLLRRECEGSFRFGGEWSEVNDSCSYSDFTHTLCDITNFEVNKQFSKVAIATREAANFDASDISLVSTIVRGLASSMEAATNRAHQESFTQTFANLLNANKETMTISQQQFNSSSELLESLEIFALRLQVTENSTIRLTTDLLQIQAEDLNVSGFSGQSFAPVLPVVDVDGVLSGVNITLPQSIVDDVTTDIFRVVNFILLRDTLFVYNITDTRFQEQSLGNLFVSASLAQRVRGLSQPISIQFLLQKNDANMTTSISCVFWDLSARDGLGDWSSEGCQVLSSDKESVVCQCDHLTHFGVLLAIAPTPPSPLLEIITYVGICVSLVCIFIILLTYLCSRSLRRNVTGKMIINMCIPLGMFYIWFLLAIQGRYYSSVQWFCSVCTSLVQFFLLVYLCWTSMEAVHIYLKLVRVFGSDVSNFVLKSAVFAWGVPLLITGLTSGLVLGLDPQLWANYDNSGSLLFCYPSEWPLYFGIITPFVLLFLFNITLFLVIMTSLTRRLYGNTKILSEHNYLKEIRKLIVIGTILFVLFSLGWAFGLLASIPQPVISSIAQYLFSILIGFQGVLLFIMHGLRSADVRKQWKQWFHKLYHCGSTPLDHMTNFTRSQFPSTSLKVPITVYKEPTTAEFSQHSENPLYQATDGLEEQGSYSPVHRTTGGDGSMVSPLKLSKFVKEQREVQTLEVNFNIATPGESSEDELDLTLIDKVWYKDESGATFRSDHRLTKVSDTEETIEL